MATMQTAPDLGIPEVKPAIESIRGQWYSKVSPQRTHAIVQGRFWRLLTDWAGERGEVGTEWRFYLLPPRETPSSLVPDVAFVSFERMPLQFGELRERPTIAPDIAVEILSPGDRRALLDTKIALYLENGAQLIIVVDPATRSIEMHERGSVRVFAGGATAASARYPGLRIDPAIVFAKL